MKIQYVLSPSLFPVLCRRTALVLCVALVAALIPAAWAAAAMSDTEFLELCIGGDAGEIRQAIREGANPNARNEYGFTALMFAADSKNAQAIEPLLEAGADVSAKNRYGWTALMVAAWSNNPAAVTRLLSAGADRDAQDEDGLTALAGTAKWGYTEAARALLSAGADPKIADNEGHDALWHARNPSEDVDQAGAAAVRRLLEEADSAAGQAGNTTPKSAAPVLSDEEFTELCESGTEEQVRQALRNGSDPDARRYFDWGSLPALTLAAQAGNLGAVRALLEAGAQVDGADSDIGTTALMAAADAGHPGIVEALLAAGADPSLKDIDGNSALQYARQSEAKEKAAVIRLLEDAVSKLQ